ncbi:MAG TPA: hypothetical protein VGX69_00555 [Solirubrobacteraceae bacterium]|nr:hypothetical protein [Solirubrobacteraceae bacterium]
MMQFPSGLPRRARVLAAAAAAVLAICAACGASVPTLAAKTGGTARSASAPVATAARTIAFSETAHLHAVSSGGSTITEEGRATGTFSCSITVHLVIETAERVHATFTVRPREGTVSGSGSARLQSEARAGYFGGTLAITKGTGAFAHASGRNIGLSGSFNRETLSATVHVHGTVHA